MGEKTLPRNTFHAIHFCDSLFVKKGGCRLWSNKKLVVTTKDKRYHVHKDVLDKKLKGSEAAQILGLSSAYLPRLKKRLLYDGFDGLLRKFPASAPHKKISEKDARQILWEGFGLTVEGGLEQLATVCSIEAKVKGQDTRRMKIPQPRKQSLGLLETLKIKLPEALPKSDIRAGTRKNFTNDEKPGNIKALQLFLSFHLRRTSVLKYSTF